MPVKKTSCDSHKTRESTGGTSEKADIIGEKYCGHGDTIEIKAMASIVQLMTKI